MNRRKRQMTNIRIKGITPSEEIQCSTTVRIRETYKAPWKNVQCEKIAAYAINNKPYCKTHAKAEGFALLLKENLS